jgi:hypothetical protein
VYIHLHNQKQVKHRQGAVAVEGAERYCMKRDLTEKVFSLFSFLLSFVPLFGFVLEKVCTGESKCGR